MIPKGNTIFHEFTDVQYLFFVGVLWAIVYNKSSTWHRKPINKLEELKRKHLGLKTMPLVWRE
jgi:hypothetical protein